MKYKYPARWEPDNIDLREDKRFLLSKEIDSNNVIAFIGMNPSKANLEQSDNTITCFIKSIICSDIMRYTGYVILNIMPFIQTDISSVKNFRDYDKNIVHENFKKIKNVLKEKNIKTIFICWGSKIDKEFNKDISNMWKYLNENHENKVCFIKSNKDGNPCHPRGHGSDYLKFKKLKWMKI